MAYHRKKNPDTGETDLIIDLASVNCIQLLYKGKGHNAYEIFFHGGGSIKVKSAGLIKEFEEYLDEYEEIYMQ